MKAIYNVCNACCGMENIACIFIYSLISEEHTFNLIMKKSVRVAIKPLNIYVKQI